MLNSKHLKYCSILSICALPIGAPFAAGAITKEGKGKIIRQEIPGEYVVAFKAGISAENWKTLFSPQKNSPQVLISPKVANFPTLVKISGQATMMKSLEKDSRVAWVSPSYEYIGDVQDEDEKIAEQYHHPVMNNPKAWEIETGKPNIIVAVTDDGIDLSHPDLKDQIWTNQNEIAGNGVDDDSNGYIDDVNGWDFATKNNDPNPNNPKVNQHGTHVAGIVAATANDIGVRGVAPGATLMPIQFYNGGAFKSAIIAEAYAYAVDNGAKILTTSYSIDQFVGDKVFETALDYVQSKGALHFNSAGNNFEEDPARGVFDQLVLVCSTRGDGTAEADQKSSFSNYGKGIDLCAPGGAGSSSGKIGILSTIPGNQYARMSGTSMATPAAAGTAALIWSANPDFTRDQVRERLLSTTDSIDDANPEFKGKLGSGRINSFRALNP